MHSLIYYSVSEEILSSVLMQDATAHAIWTAVEGLFYDNKASCALVLEAEFWTTEQGDQMVFQYSQRLNTLANSLLLANKAPLTLWCCSCLVVELDQGYRRGQSI